MNFNKREDDLINNALKNREAFEKLTHLYYEGIFSYIYKRTFDKDISEDLTQKTFLKVFTHLHTFKGKCPLKFWILRIATNVVNGYCRREIRNRKHMEKLQYTINSEDSNDSDKEKAGYKVLHKHIMYLKPVYQTIIVLKFFNQADFKEIASVLNKSPAATRGLYHRALDSLKKDIEKNVTDLELLHLIYGGKDEEG